MRHRRQWRVTIGSTAIAWLALLAMPRAHPVTIIRNNGPSANRVDIVILGDGYTAAEITSGKYANDVEQMVKSLFGQEPYSEYRNYYNVRRVDVPSADSGSDHPERNPQEYVDTAFDGTYNCAGIARLICVDNNKVNAAISASGIAASERDAVLVLVNDTTYGGSGGAIAVASLHSSVVELVLHEMGHSFGLLADEYGGPPPPACVTTEPAAVNATRETTRALIKWHAWIDASTPIPTTGTAPAVPGLYEGAVYCTTGAYRPTYNSKMRSLGVPFEQINVEQHVKRVYNYVSPIDGSSPAGSMITTGPSQLFTVTVLQPFAHNLTIEWRVDNVLLGNGSSFTATGLSAGAHTVTVMVSDPTTMVRSDPTGLLDDLRVWTLTTVTQPGAFNKTAPVNGATGQSTSPTLTWGASSGVTGYEYCYDTTNDNACSGWTSTGTTASAGLSGLSPGTTYFWQVRANNGNGTTYANGSATAFWSFTTTTELPPLVVGQGPHPGNGGWFQARRGQAESFAGIEWHQVPWAAYAKSGGEVHPAFGDVDGDGRDEVVAGLGPGGAGWIAVLDDAANHYALLQWIQVQWVTYNRARGEVFPAVADLDGDGKAEIVAGLGPGGHGWFEIFNDAAAGYAHLAWKQTTWTAYNASPGATHPAAGDVDGDGKAEIVVGLGPSSGGWLEVFDDAGNGYAHAAWVQVIWPAYTQNHGTTFPAVGDVDGDTKAEVVVGLGLGGGGWVEVFNDAVAGYAHASWQRVNWTAYNQTVGEVHPAVGNLDNDAAAEVVFGLASYPGNGGWFEVRDDSSHGFTSLGWRNLDWPAFKTAGGATWPAIGKPSAGAGQGSKPAPRPVDPLTFGAVVPFGEPGTVPNHRR